MADGSAVKVAVRVRPLNSREKKMKATTIIRMQGKQTQIQNPAMAADIKKFSFDFSYDSSCDPSNREYVTQTQVYNDLGKDVVKSCFDGYNACVFAYGQTGSGKSYTMMGYGEMGLIPRICSGIFERASKEKEKDADSSFVAEVGYLEIYNEKVRDLLGEKKNASGFHNLRVREDPKLGPFVDGLTSHTVVDYEGIDALMERGNACRTTAATNMNDTSSRSHAVFTMRFTQASLIEGVPCEKTSKINLVDLAGSERSSSTGATGARLKEGANINKSLTCLGLVIHALAERSGKKGKKSKGAKGDFVPYRDSVLTWLLKESLGGNSKTIMVAALSPADVNYGETLSTLHYANRAKNIVNKAVVNEDENVRLIKELRAEVLRLKELLGGDEAIQALEDKREEAQRRLDEATTDEERAAAEAELKSAESELNSASKSADEKAAALSKAEDAMSAMTSQWKDKWKEQTDLMESRALHVKETGSALRVDSERPHLVSLNLDDPLATGVTLYYLNEGSTLCGTTGTTDKMGTGPDVPLVGGDTAAEHCVLENEDDKIVKLLPREGKCNVNGVTVKAEMELMQGMTIVLGRDNIFRFNHPYHANKLRAERESAQSREAEGGEAPPAGSLATTPQSGSAVYSPGQIFEDQRAEERKRLQETQLRLEELQKAQELREAEDAQLAADRVKKEAEAAQLQQKLKDMEEAVLAKEAERETLLAQSEEEKASAQAAALAEMERVKAASDAAAQALKDMEAEKERLAAEHEAALGKERQERDRELAEQAESQARLEELEQKLLQGEEERERLLEQEAKALEMEKKLMEAEQRSREQEEEQARFEAKQEKLRLENEKLKKQEKKRALEQSQVKHSAAKATKEKAEAMAKFQQAEEKLKALEAINEANELQIAAEKKRADEAAVVKAKQIQTLERKLKKAETMTIRHQESGSFEDMWSVRIPRFHFREGQGKTYVQFEIKITLRGEEWKVFRRYSQFEALHKELIRRMGKASLGGIDLPTKGALWQNKKSEGFLKERKQMLEKYLSGMIARTYNYNASPFYRTTKVKLQRELAFFNNAAHLIT
mmetsp:Transcript_9007/g.23194  ORF Transcript_9007/g.23194 Transcript_9007/m.23194 type:complete len:1067 (+) Transcript_9007:151-3351(+)